MNDFYGRKFKVGSYVYLEGNACLYRIDKLPTKGRNGLVVLHMINFRPTERRSYAIDNPVLGSMKIMIKEEIILAVLRGSD